MGEIFIEKNTTHGYNLFLKLKRLKLMKVNMKSGKYILKPKSR